MPCRCCSSLARCSSQAWRTHLARCSSQAWRTHLARCSCQLTPTYGAAMAELLSHGVPIEQLLQHLPRPTPMPWQGQGQQLQQQGARLGQQQQHGQHVGQGLSLLRTSPMQGVAGGERDRAALGRGWLTGGLGRADSPGTPANAEPTRLGFLLAPAARTAVPAVARPTLLPSSGHLMCPNCWGRWRRSPLCSVTAPPLGGACSSSSSSASSLKRLGE
ncbi:hypothetical protein V8C86DRAFT_1216203 [Haematococcus lacustris]